MLLLYTTLPVAVCMQQLDIPMDPLLHKCFDHESTHMPKLGLKPIDANKSRNHLGLIWCSNLKSLSYMDRGLKCQTCAASWVSIQKNSLRTTELCTSWTWTITILEALMQVGGQTPWTIIHWRPRPQASRVLRDTCLILVPTRWGELPIPLQPLTSKHMDGTTTMYRRLSCYYETDILTIPIWAMSFMSLPHDSTRPVIITLEVVCEVCKHGSQMIMPPPPLAEQLSNKYLIVLKLIMGCHR